MKYLERRIGQWFVIDLPEGEVWVQVCRIAYYKGRPEVKLGFAAPREIPIERDDMHKRTVALKPGGTQS